MVLTTTSTSDFCNAVTRSRSTGSGTRLCDGAPKMSRAISPAMSTSKPVISPVIGVAKAEQVAADIEPDDQPAAGPDIGNRGVRVGLIGERAQAGGRVAVLAGIVGRQRGLGRHLVHAEGRGRWQGRHGGPSSATPCARNPPA